MPQSKELLFTYGTLRKAVDSPMQQFLTDRTTWIGEAYFQGKLFFVGSHPAAIPSTSSTNIVIGDLFEVHASSDLISRLDRYEGFDKNNPQKSLYIREKVEVRLKETNKYFDAWIYLFNRPVDGSQKINSGDYLSFIH